MRDSTGIEARRKADGSTSYRACVYDPRERKLIRKTFANITAARQWRRDALAAVAAGELEATPARTPRVEDALDDLIAGMKTGLVLTRSRARYKPGTIRTYSYSIRDVLKPQLGHLHLHEVRRRDVQRIVDELNAGDGGYSGSTIRSIIDPLRVLYRRAIRDEIVTVNPCRDLDIPARRPEPKRALAPETVEGLLDALPHDLRALWATAFYAGLRRGELRALRWTDVDLDGGVIHVRRSWDDVEGEQAPKSFAGIRDVLILPQLALELARHGLATARVGSALVFGRSATEPFARESVNRRAREAWGWKLTRKTKTRPGGWEPATANPLQQVTLHEARHCAASFLVAAGLDVKTVQTYMGHSDSRVTLEIYAHAIPDRHKRDAEQVAAWLEQARG